MTEILFDFEGTWYEVYGKGELPVDWHPYGDQKRTCEYGFPNLNDPHLSHLVKTGVRSLGYEKVWDTHRGGALYVIATEPGDELVFSMFGRYIFQADAGVQIGDIHMRIGIDPEGGVDPDAQSVVWSAEQEIAVNGFDGPIEWSHFGVSVEAESTRATLFLFTNPTERGARHSGPVWDDGRVTITEPPDPPPGDCWGLPREDYTRTVNVVVDKDAARKVLEETWPQTISNSYDDAGIGQLGDKTAVLWDIPLVQREAYNNFYTKWYPRTKVFFRSLGEEPDEPDDPDVPVKPRKLGAGLHLQTGVEGDLDYYTRAKPSYVKLFQFEPVVDFRAANPDVVTAVRYYTSEQHIPRYRLGTRTQELNTLSIADLMGRQEVERARAPSPAAAMGDAFVVNAVRDEIKRRLSAPSGPERAAASYIGTMADALRANPPKYVEGFNEMVGSSDREFNQLVVEFETAFAYQIADKFPDTRACLLNVAVGNPPEDWVVDLLPAVRAAVETGGTIAYHSYWWGNPDETGLLSWFEHHAGRVFEWDKVFDAHGLAPNYLLTECGVVGSDNGYHLKPHEGWRSSAALKGDFDRYLKEIQEFEGYINAWNATHNNRCLGYCLFTSGASYVGWDSFKITVEEMARL